MRFWIILLVILSASPVLAQTDAPSCYIYDVEITGTVDQLNFSIDGEMALIAETANTTTTNDVNLFEGWISASSPSSLAGERGAIALMTNSAYYPPGETRQQRYDLTNIAMTADLDRFTIQALPENAVFFVNNFAVSSLLVYAINEGDVIFSFTDREAQEIIGSIDLIGTSWTSDDSVVYRANFRGDFREIVNDCDIPNI